MKDRLKKIKKGDKFLIDYGISIYKVKLLFNDVDNEKMLVKVNIGMFWILNTKILLKYQSHNLQNFETLNPKL